MDPIQIRQSNANPRIVKIRIMNETSIFKWSFKPEFLFRLGEDQIECKLDDYRLLIKDGEVSVIVPDLRAFDGWPNLPDIRKEVRRGIERFLDSRAIWKHKTYELSYAEQNIPESLKEKLGHVVRVNTSETIKTESHVDFKITDAEGDVQFDSKEDRKKRIEKIGNLTHKYYYDDVTTYFITRRYRKAIDDPDNEFIHLFDILEALKDRFDTGNKGVKSRFGIDKDKFNTFCALANNEPVRQGRHRGQHVENLRDATDEEREVARQVAREMVFGYLEFLDEEKS